MRRPWTPDRPTSPRPRPDRGAPSGVSSAGGTGAQFVVGVEDGEAAVVVAGGSAGTHASTDVDAGDGAAPEEDEGHGARVVFDDAFERRGPGEGLDAQGADAPFDLDADAT